MIFHTESYFSHSVKKKKKLSYVPMPLIKNIVTCRKVQLLQMCLKSVFGPYIYIFKCKVFLEMQSVKIGLENITKCASLAPPDCIRSHRLYEYKCRNDRMSDFIRQSLALTGLLNPSKKTP